MYLKIKNRKIKLYEYKSFIEKVKSFRFYLKEINYAIKLPNKKIANTYFFCQKIDICFTNKNDEIIYLYKNVSSEKIIIKIKAKNIYYLPLKTTENLKIGEKLNIIEDKK